MNGNLTLEELEKAFRLVEDIANPFIALAKKYGAKLPEDLIVVPQSYLDQFPELERWKDTEGVKVSKLVDQIYIFKGIILNPISIKPYYED